MKQATLIILLAVVGFAVAFAMFVVGRLNQEQVALLAGVACGVGVAVPLGIAIGLVVNRRRREREVNAPSHIIYVTPPAAPPPPQSSLMSTGWSTSIEPPASVAAPRRSFNVIGNSDFEEEK